MRLAPRRHRKSSRSLVILAVKFILPLLSVFTFFTVTYFVTSASLDHVRITQQFDMAAHARMVDAAETPMLTRGAVAAIGGSATVQPLIDVAAKRVTSLEYHHRLFSYMGAAAEPELELVAELAAKQMNYLDDADARTLQTLKFGDVCGVLAEMGDDPNFDLTACREFRGGVLMKGYQGAILNYLALARSILARRQVANVTAANGVGVLLVAGVEVPYSLVDEMNGEDLNDALDFVKFYLVPAFDITANFFAAKSLATVDTMRTFMVAFLVAFLLLFSAYQFGVFLPQVVRTNEEIQQERVVLLLLPARLLQAVPELTDLLTRMLEAEDKAMAASAAASEA